MATSFLYVQKARSCMMMANLNLQQCVAASHRHYEVPFCIAEHAIPAMQTSFSALERSGDVFTWDPI